MPHDSILNLIIACVFPVTTGEFQPSGFRPGLPAAHLPTHWENQPAAGDQPSAAEADLQPAEGQRVDKDQGGVCLLCTRAYIYYSAVSVSVYEENLELSVHTFPPLLST